MGFTALEQVEEEHCSAILVSYSVSCSRCLVCEGVVIIVGHMDSLKAPPYPRALGSPSCRSWES